MPNRQSPNDPNLERDLWGDDDRPDDRLDRPVIDLTPKQRDAGLAHNDQTHQTDRISHIDRVDQTDRKDYQNQTETSNWDDDGETSNWDDADDYGREYDEIPSYSASPTAQTPSEALGRDAEAIAKVESSRVAANFGDPDLFEATDPTPDEGEGELIGDDPSLSSASARETVDDLAMDTMDVMDTVNGVNSNTDDEFVEEPAYQPDVPMIVTEKVEESAETIVAVDERDRRDQSVLQDTVMITVSASETREKRPIEGDADKLAVQAEDLRREIAQLQAQKSELQTDLSRLVRESLQDLADRRQELQTAVEKLERRQTRIQEEMQTTFAGASQDLAVRVQGFKEYLVGSLQDLTLAAERLQLSPETSPSARMARTAPRDSAPPTVRLPIDQPTRPSNEQSRPPRPIVQDSTRERGTPLTIQQSPQSSQPLRAERSERLDRPDQPERLGSPNLNDRRDRPDRNTEDPSFGKKGFQDQASFIRSTLDRYREQPDYYGPPWQLRRTFQPVQAERVSDWFFNQSGRGVVRSMGSRLQNILIASTTISILRGVYDKRLRTLVLANSPERLGEWRRGLQDCLGITRNDFGPDRGITLFEDPMLMAQKAERLVKAGWLPLIVMDESEAQLNLSLLQFPLWLAFAADPSRAPSFDRDWMVRQRS